MAKNRVFSFCAVQTAQGAPNTCRFRDRRTQGLRDRQQDNRNGFVPCFLITSFHFVSFRSIRVYMATLDGLVLATFDFNASCYPRLWAL